MKTIHRQVADRALFAFWQVVALNFPTARTGDLSPWTTHRLDMVAEEAVAEWVYANVPQSDQ